MYASFIKGMSAILVIYRDLDDHVRARARLLKDFFEIFERLLL